MMRKTIVKRHGRRTHKGRKTIVRSHPRRIKRRIVRMGFLINPKKMIEIEYLPFINPGDDVMNFHQVTQQIPLEGREKFLEQIKLMAPERLAKKKDVGAVIADLTRSDPLLLHEAFKETIKQNPDLKVRTSFETERADTLENFAVTKHGIDNFRAIFEKGIEHDLGEKGFVKLSKVGPEEIDLIRKGDKWVRKTFPEKFGKDDLEDLQ